MTSYFPGILANGSLVPGLAAATVRTSIGLGTADSPTFASGTFNGTLAITHTTNDAIEITRTGFGTLLTVGLLGNISGGAASFTQKIGHQVAALEAVSAAASLQSLFVIGAPGQTANLSEWRNSNGNILSSVSASGSPTFVGPLEVRNSTTAQRLRVAKTWASATSFEQFEIDTSPAGFLDLVALRGSLGGAENGIRIGGKLDGGSFVPWLSINAIGAATFVGSIAASGIVGQISVATPGIVSCRTFQFGGTIQNPKIYFDMETFSGADYLSIFDENYFYGNLLVGKLGLGLNNTTAIVHIKAGTATAGTAPLKLTAGVNLTTPEVGAIEYDGTNVYFTDSGGTRRQLAVVP